MQPIDDFDSSESLSEIPPSPTMESLEMSGSYSLSREAIDQVMSRKSPGNYALGYMVDDTFDVFYVGRSDSDVKQRLHEWIDVPSRSETYASSGKAAWDVRCGDVLPLNAPVLGRVGNVSSSYTRFAYSYARSAEDAYAKEWRNYDAFGGSRTLDNQREPASSPATYGT